MQTGIVINAFFYSPIIDNLSLCKCRHSKRSSIGSYEQLYFNLESEWHTMTVGICFRLHNQQLLFPCIEQFQSSINRYYS